MIMKEKYKKLGIGILMFVIGFAIWCGIIKAFQSSNSIVTFNAKVVEIQKIERTKLLVSKTDENTNIYKIDNTEKYVMTVKLIEPNKILNNKNTKLNINIDSLTAKKYTVGKVYKFAIPTENITHYSINSSHDTFIVIMILVALLGIGAIGVYLMIKGVINICDSIVGIASPF